MYFGFVYWILWMSLFITRNSRKNARKHENKKELVGRDTYSTLPRPPRKSKICSAKPGPMDRSAHTKTHKTQRNARKGGQGRRDGRVVCTHLERAWLFGSINKKRELAQVGKAHLRRHASLWLARLRKLTRIAFFLRRHALLRLIAYAGIACRLEKC